MTASDDLTAFVREALAPGEGRERIEGALLQAGCFTLQTEELER